MLQILSKNSISERDFSSIIRFPLPEIKCTFNICGVCKYCCQWCDYISQTGCAAKPEYPLLSLCHAFPILIGRAEGRYPSLGVGEEQYPPEFGAFVPLGNHCLATLHEQQRSVFQAAARYINSGFRNFSIYLAEEGYFVLITVKDSINCTKTQSTLLTPAQIVVKLQQTTLSSNPT